MANAAHSLKKVDRRIWLFFYLFFPPLQVSAAVANFYVPTLSMLYIYGRIFNCIRQRSRNDLGEVSGARMRTQQQQQQQSTAVPNQQLPILPGITSDNGETTSFHEHAQEDSPTVEEHHPKRQHLAIPGWDKLKAVKWRHRRTPTATESDDSSLSNRRFYETLTLLELNNGSGVGSVGNETRTGLTHYVNVRVNVEYIGDSQQQPPLGGNQPTTATDTNGSANRGPCKSSSSTPIVGMTGGNSSVTTQLNPTALISHKERKAARQLGVIMCAFIVCWLPYFIVFMVVAVCPDCVSDTLFKITLWLGYVNSTLNPVLYPLCNANFRRAFAKMLTFQSPCQPQQTYPTGNAAAQSTATGINHQSRF